MMKVIVSMHTKESEGGILAHSLTPSSLNRSHPPYIYWLFERLHAQSICTPTESRSAERTRMAC